MKVVVKPLSELVPDPKNTRIHDENNIQMIMRSLEKFGQYRAMVVQKNGMIVRVGNGMFEAMKRLGWTEASVEIKDIDDEEATALSIVDNKASDLSLFDDKKLTATLNALPTEILDFTGFTSSQINNSLFTTKKKVSKFDKLTDCPSYSFVFDTQEELDRWEKFVDYLKKRYNAGKEVKNGSLLIQLVNDDKILGEVLK